ncbi:MAG: hypothetical protein NBKEAIPA_02398 [Nitrospirae bacterium]|nr:MAG: hypothetical protein UZ03_NOB001002965 [Nitrospira sp. OLB3]MBV6470483.1 hypothetical protein [Nitrospirota bacterium]MCK6494409.1 glycosyltransferase [Nitrospira sp.]MEB2338609.1 glycosyltransferase [Nitrospirales bacterium]QOJ33645.1 MAG: glycosyltransferase [Nitrospira sp.]
MNMLEANVARIKAQNAELAAALNNMRGGVLSVTPARSGVPTAQREGRWVHSAYDPVREADTWATGHAKVCRSGETVILAGIGLLYHVEALRRVLSPDTEIALLVFDVNELRDALVARPLGSWCDQVQWLFGAPVELAEGLAKAGRPLRCLTYAPAAQAQVRSYDAFEAALRQNLAGRVGGQLTVAVVAPIYGGSLPIAGYVRRALEALGHRVVFIDHSLHAASYGAMGRLKDSRNRQLMQGRLAEVLSQWTLATLAESPPDLVLSLAQAPLTLPVLEHLRKKKFVTAMWFVENSRHLTYWQQLAPGYEFWFIIQRGSSLDAFKHAGARSVHYLPVAADPVVHRPVTLSDEERRTYGSDLSFVGAGYANRRHLFPQLLRQPWTFKIWGNEWDGADEVRPALQLQGARIDTETCVKVFNASTINLNLHSALGSGVDPEADFVNPRTFELAACGAFQLLDHRSLLRELFEEHEIVSFASFDEVPRLVSAWLGDASARRAMATAARDRVLRAHTYEHRMKDLLATIGLAYPDRLGAVLRGDRQRETLLARCRDDRPLASLLNSFPNGQRVELKDVAATIRARGPSVLLSKEELMILMLDEYRSETRDLL